MFGPPNTIARGRGRESAFVSMGSTLICQRSGVEQSYATQYLHECPDRFSGDLERAGARVCRQRSGWRFFLGIPKRCRWTLISVKCSVWHQKANPAL